MPRNWPEKVEDLTNVQKLVHLAMRYDSYDQERIKGELLQAGRRAYESELTLLAVRMGCPGRSGSLTNGAYLSELNEIYVMHAASIVNTYNYDLAVQIDFLRAQNVRGNRHYYAYHLRQWHETRAQLKNEQIALMTDSVARTLAQQHFYANNGDLGSVAVLLPTTAVCPVCQGWIERGEVPVHEAMNHPPPYHVGCPHSWNFRKADKLSKEDCELLWMGG